MAKKKLPKDVIEVLAFYGNSAAYKLNGTPEDDKLANSTPIVQDGGKAARAILVDYEAA